MCLTCAFDLFFENELSNCLLSLLLAVYLFFLSPFGDVCGLQPYLPL